MTSELTNYEVFYLNSKELCFMTLTSENNKMVMTE